MTLKTLIRLLVCLCVQLFLQSALAAETNIVLVMTDDQGWGDVGYNGHPHLVTPTLDEMAASGLRFDRFYAARSVCSPSRAGFLTGRNPVRTGTLSANWSFRPEELTIAKVLRDHGYATAHFGKWHLGTVKPDSSVNPAAMGFDHYLSHDNWFDLDPELSRNGAAPRQYDGESSIVLAEHAGAFMKEAVRDDKPFFIVVWFASPHSPQIASEEDYAHYKDIPGLTDKQKNYYGEITGIDRAMARIRGSLRELGVAENTLLFFTSDNGPSKGLDYDKWAAGGLRGMKGSIYEGGIREPTVIEWPARILQPRQTSIPATALDLFPTLLALIGMSPPKDLPIDGINILDLIDGTMTERPAPIAFWRYPSPGDEEANEPWLSEEVQTGWWRTFRNYTHPVITNNFNGHAAWVDGDWKLHKIDGALELYNLRTDPDESDNILSENRERGMAMAKQLIDWQRSAELSLSGADYPVKAVRKNQ